MAEFACQCLNVTVSCLLSSHIEEFYVGQLGGPAAITTDPFFQNKLFKANLDSRSISIAQNNLIKNRQIGKFSIVKCCSCNQDTHAIYENNEMVLVNLSLEHDPVKIKELKERENYSNLFKIILPPIQDYAKKSALELKLQSKSCQLDTIVQVIRQQATTYLCSAQKEMDDRIRLFTEQQYAEYNSLQVRIMAERQALIDLLAQVHSNDAAKMSLPMPLTNFPSPPTSPDNSENTPSMEYTFKDSPQAQVPKTVVKVASSQLSNNIRSFGPKEVPESSRYRRTHDAAIFDMDGLEDDSAPFPLTDDEADTDDSTTDDLSSGFRRHNQQRQTYATSCPISVPLWSAMSHSELSDDDDDKNNACDPQLIAASIQALALSIRDDKELFGDLPRRRLNTGDLVKSRPI